MLPGITLRPARGADADFAYLVLERTMKDYAVATWGSWKEVEARTSVADDVAAGRLQIIELDRIPVGFLRVDRHASHHDLDSFFILPEVQSRGIGSSVLSLVLADARAANLAVRLRVLRVNPAKAFYLRHGFRVVSESADSFFMENAAPPEAERFPPAIAVGAVSIRRGTIQDAERISALVTGLSEEYIVGEFSAGGRAHFLQDHMTARVRERLAGDFRFYLAESGNELAAVAAIRSNAHLYYLFVARPFQKMGLARRLWEQVKAEALALGNSGAFTVNASNFAVSAYERLGFRRTEPMKEQNGVLYNPMRFVAAG